MMSSIAFRLARPITLWSLHFIALYALISAACAPRGVIDFATMRIAVGVVTLCAAAVAAVWLVQALRRLRKAPDDAPDRSLLIAVKWTALISLLAIIANLWPVATLATCAG